MSNGYINPSLPVERVVSTVYVNFMSSPRTVFHPVESLKGPHILVFISAILSTWASRLTDVKFNFVRGAATINETDDNSYPLADTLNV